MKTMKYQETFNKTTSQWMDIDAIDGQKDY